MKTRLFLSIILAMLIVSACGQKSLSEPMTLLNQNQEEVTFPSDKPAVFFFITTYT
ncbi:hypothetical protein [Cytobacillus gottheilii]|uniref:hypothetical protein n=1 Tax=Cytobacillus gottheilii TaxID=859144 RepID=UPI0015933EDB|nr:hypothetical protein [Cytobacillus gottheilii]